MLHLLIYQCPHGAERMDTIIAQASLLTKLKKSGHNIEVIQIYK
jgi:hypothetical protein